MFTKSNRVIFIGDTHFDSRTPLSRSDDFAQETINKLENLLTQAMGNNVGHIIVTGDFFDGSQQTMVYLNKLIKVLNKFKANGIRIHSIIGNHDMPHDNMNYFPQTPLHMLFETGVIERLTKLELENTTIYGLDFGQRDNIDALSETLTQDNKKKVLVMHYATDNTFPGGSISREQLKAFNLVVSGHDHMPYDYKNTDTPIVLRPGSFTRRTKDWYNLERDITIYLVDTNNGLEIETLTLQGVKPASEIFKNEVFNNKVSHLSGLDVTELFKQITADIGEAKTVAQIIDALPAGISQDTRDQLHKYITELGIE